jgi:hypothetical protein
MGTPVQGGRQRSLTYANVMSAIAAFLALGGTATAATVVITGRGHPRRISHRQGHQESIDRAE